MKKLHFALLVGTLAVALEGCSAPDAIVSDAAPGTVQAVDDLTMFSEASVTVAADGSTEITTRAISAGEERAQARARQQEMSGAPVQRTVLDRNCAFSSFWLYDRPDWTGNRLCFSGRGEINLRPLLPKVCKMINGWPWCEPRILTNGSYWAGDAPGLMTDSGGRPDGMPDAGVPMTIPFGANQKDRFWAFPLGTLALFGVTN